MGTTGSAPKLVDYHLAPEDVTEELPEAYGYESVWETVEGDLGGFRAARATARGERPARSATRSAR